MPIGFINRHRRAISAVAVAAVAAIAVMFFTQEPGLPSELADGAYANDCCGIVELRGGRMIANGGNLVSYIVQEDEQGPYVLPGSFVGAQYGGIMLVGARPVVKLRLDRLPNPTRISIPGLWAPVSFARTRRRAS